MAPRSEFSAQTLSVLAALTREPSRWRHGYEIAQQTGLKSGTLYPILIRLSDRGLLEACWEDEPAAGRPRRHLNRLTPDGLAAARTAIAAAPSPSPSPSPSPAPSPSPSPGKARRARRPIVQGPALEQAG